MAKKIFIAATSQNCGKTTMSVSLMHLARLKYERVGFIKPIGPKYEMFGDLMVDMDAILMARTFGLEEVNYCRGRIHPRTVSGPLLKQGENPFSPCFFYEFFLSFRA